MALVEKVFGYRQDVRVGSSFADLEPARERVRRLGFRAEDDPEEGRPLPTRLTPTYQRRPSPVLRTRQAVRTPRPAVTTIDEEITNLVAEAPPLTEVQIESAAWILAALPPDDTVTLRFWMVGRE